MNDGESDNLLFDCLSLNYRRVWGKRRQLLVSCIQIGPLLQPHHRAMQNAVLAKLFADITDDNDRSIIRTRSTIGGG